MDSVFLISKQTGKVAWKIGGASYSKDGAPLIEVKNDPLGGFFRQHDARFLPDGTISMFDDQTGVTGPARGLVLSYDLSTNTASVAWQFQGKGPSLAMGSLRVLPDGSRTIGWGFLPGAPALTEVDAKGAVHREVTLTGATTRTAVRRCPSPSSTSTSCGRPRAARTERHCDFRSCSCICFFWASTSTASGGPLS